MPVFVVLYRFTDQGRKAIKGTVKRAQAIAQENEARGFTVIGHWWTMGRYDLVTVVDAPSEEAMMSGLLSVAERANATSETLRAFSDHEMEDILGRTGTP